MMRGRPSSPIKRERKSTEREMEQLESLPKNKGETNGLCVGLGASFRFQSEGRPRRNRVNARSTNEGRPLRATSCGQRTRVVQ